MQASSPKYELSLPFVNDILICAPPFFPLIFQGVAFVFFFSFGFRSVLNFPFFWYDALPEDVYSPICLEKKPLNILLLETVV